MKSVCVYCGSSDKIKSKYLEAARTLGKEIAGRGMVLWFGAGSTGMMGEVANGALENGGEVIGVIPELFNTPALAHDNLTRIEVVDSMHLRKQRLAEQADAFIALPGGFGTFEEFFEILTWSQIGIHQKPIGLLNTDQYYDLLLDMLNHALEEGFLYEEHHSLFTIAQSPGTLIDTLMNFQRPSGVDRWITRQD